MNFAEFFQVLGYFRKHVLFYMLNSSLGGVCTPGWMQVTLKKKPKQSLMAYAIYLHLWLLQKDIPPCTCHIETKRQFQGWWLPLDYNLRHIFDRYIWETKIYKRHIKIHPPFTTDVIDFSQIHYVGLPIFDCCSADRSDSWGIKFLSPVRYTL